MNNEWLSRTELLIGEKGVETLKNKHVLVIGIGGVGAYAAEMLCRAGIGEMTIIDGDVVSESNRNRQLLALVSTKNFPKTEVLFRRLKDINPEIKLSVIQEYIKDDRIKEIISEDYDYVIDAIDTLLPKTKLIYETTQRKIPLISSMGTGGKTDPTKMEITDISKTHNCKLARILRKRLHRFNIYEGFKVVFSPQEIDMNSVILSEAENQKSVVGTISYMPAIFGCACASVVIRDLLEMK